MLICVYLVAVALPLILSWVTGGPPRPVLQEIASGLGILAYAMILAEFVLSGRFKSVSNSVGMDVAMWFHQMLARIALGFALLHPFLYGGSPSGGARPWDPTRALTVTTDFTALASGILAFALLPALVMFAVHRDKLDYKYETWRLMHGIGAVVIALALLHHAVNAGRYGGHPVMVWVWIILTGIAVTSLAYFYLLVPLRAWGKPWRVTSVTQLTPKQWEVTVAPQKGAGLDYKAGQFAWLNIGHSAFSLHENPFSIASAPASGPELNFMIKELGDFTRTIGEITPGTPAYVDGAYGNLSIDGRNEPGVALIAGGIGIAPLIGILRQMRLTGDPRAVRMIYGNRSAEQITCRDELAGEDVTFVLSEPLPDWTGACGLIDPALLDRVFTRDEMRDWVFVMCGPGAMMDMVEDHLIAHGTPSDRILSERFQYD